MGTAIIFICLAFVILVALGGLALATLDKETYSQYEKRNEDGWD